MLFENQLQWYQMDQSMKDYIEVGERARHMYTWWEIEQLQSNEF